MRTGMCNARRSNNMSLRPLNAIEQRVSWHRQVVFCSTATNVSRALHASRYYGTVLHVLRPIKYP